MLLCTVVINGVSGKEHYLFFLLIFNLADIFLKIYVLNNPHLNA